MTHTNSLKSEFKPKDVFNLKRTSSPFSQTHLKNLGRINFEFILIGSFLMLIKEDIYSSGLHKCVQLFFSTGAFKSSATAPPRCLQNLFPLLQKGSQKISASFCRMMILRNNPPWSVVIRKNCQILSRQTQQQQQQKMVDGFEARPQSWQTISKN